MRDWNICTGYYIPIHVPLLTQVGLGHPQLNIVWVTQESQISHIMSLKMGKCADDCYWFISVLETGDVASLHYFLTFFFHIRCLNSNKNPSSTDCSPYYILPQFANSNTSIWLLMQDTSNWTSEWISTSWDVQISNGYRSWYWRMRYEGIWAGFNIPVTYRYEYPQLNIVRVSWESRFDVKFLTPRAWNGETLDGCYWFINIHEIGVFHSLHHTLTHLLIGCLNIEAECVHHYHILPHIANFNTPIWH